LHNDVHFDQIAKSINRISKN